MEKAQKNKCRAIIHTHAVAAAAGNAVPVPGLGVAVDTVVMTSMVLALSAVLGGNIKEQTAKGLGFVAIKNTALRQPVQTIAKEVSKFVPMLGMLIAPGVAVAMFEAAGWSVAKELEKKLLENGSR